MQTAQVIPFDFESREIRTLLINDEPWFCAKDVCAVLGYANDSDAIKKHCREKGVAKRDSLTSGGKQSLTFINEGNLYRLIIKSRKPEAQRFESWVCDEVLPAIRQHGHYQDTRGRMETLLGQTIGPHGFKMLNAVLEGKLGHLPAKHRQAANQHIWAQVHTAFGVSQGADIPAEQLDSARNFIAAYNVIEGEWQPKEPETLTPEEQHSPQQSNLLRFRYNDRPFRCVVEGTQLWFVTADVGNALYLGDASHINPFLTPEQRGHRWVGRQRLNVMSQSGLERAMVQAELKWTLPFRRWLDGVLAQVSGGAPAPTKAIGLSSEQQSLLRDLVKNRIQALPQQQQGKAAQKCWGALKSRFNTPNYKAIVPEQFSEAVPAYP